MRLILALLCTLATPTVLEPDSDGTYRVRYNHTTSSFNWIVLGDWGDFGWYLRLDDESYNLEKFSIA